jgi:hypothetical protein
MKDQKKAESIASERVQLLSPMLAEGLAPDILGLIRQSVHILDIGL